MSKRWNIVAPVAAVMAVLTGCVTDPNSPGLEYMPDMYRSPAVEAYVDYGMDPYYVTEEVASRSGTRQCAGACRRHHCLCGGEQGVWPPYAYPNTPEGYEAAGAELGSPSRQPRRTSRRAWRFTANVQPVSRRRRQGRWRLVAQRTHRGHPSYADKLKDLPWARCTTR